MIYMGFHCFFLAFKGGWDKACSCVCIYVYMYACVCVGFGVWRGGTDVHVCLSWGVTSSCGLRGLVVAKVTCTAVLLTGPWAYLCVCAMCVFMEHDRLFCLVLFCDMLCLVGLDVVGLMEVGLGGGFFFFPFLLLPILIHSLCVLYA